MARLGLPAERSIRALRDAGLWDDDGATEETWELLAAVSETAEPADALDTIAAIASEHPETFERIRADPDLRARVLAVGGTSRPLGDLLARYPDAVIALGVSAPVSAVVVADLVAEAVRSATTEADRAAGIAAIRRRATANIAARDLTAELAVELVAAELAELAEGVLAGTLTALHEDIGGASPRATLAILGMGKLGGRELNYVSDVDVVFVHGAVNGDEDGAREEARQVFERLLSLLNASTTMGRAYEVDPTLRPEGRHGPLSRTIDSFVAYWERWAKTWEFQALIKARPVAGDRDLAERLLGRAEPFIWPEHLDPGVIQEVRDMKGRVEAKPEVLRHGERQVKLGPGGLRDIEFSVQLLQLVHGRADHSLRLTGTLPALDALARGGYVAEDDARDFATAYRQLRRVEHRLQLAQERRTHTIPSDPERQEWLARSLGYRALGDRPARETFAADLRTVQTQVRELHAKLFYRPLLEAHAVVPAADGELTLEPDRRTLTEAAAYERLEALGFRDARGALRDVRAITAGVTRRARTLRAVLPAFLHVLAESADPDTGLRMLRTVLDAHGRSSELVAHLRDHPPAAALLARVLGTSEVVGELFATQPQGADLLIDPTLRDVRRTREDLRRTALAQLSWQDDLAQRTALLRRFKRRELLRIVLRDLEGAAPVSVVGEELTALAEACLVAALEAVTHDEDDPAARMAIVGMGKLGGSELQYASDLDVLFVHEPVPGASEDEATAHALATAERVVRTLGEVTAEGTAFDVDADLRPEGKSGPLSRSLDSYAAYYDRWSEPWEHQSLLRARFVAGDDELGERFHQLTAELAYPPGGAGRATETAIRKLKARIERERVPKRTDANRHLKLGPGGMTDVEWTVQLLQQRHGHHERVVRTPSTMAAVDGLQDAGLLDSRDATWLRDGYRLLARIRNHLYLLRERNVDVLPTNPDVLERLARSLGYGRGGRQVLEEDHLRATRRIRHVTERVFYGGALT
ncbi:MAG: bifunctional [glutamine synthetase] adenylyltransferase/[glutamine synthetase]-adenylyl-L-tyrosine phosphorylase [Actinobacteria bacterium]|nr:bifunctional [glutamine synthetase] adenylyltransferase/[glutamine synthetase]-adenylyl-L-tyrosine phosphorylase [Actinomycetota bacterium]